MSKLHSMGKPVQKINLQPSHLRAYRFTEKYISENIVAPEMKEIAKGIKLTLRQTYRVIDDLCSLGYFARDAYKKRSLKIMKPLR